MNAPVGVRWGGLNLTNKFPSSCIKSPENVKVK